MAKSSSRKLFLFGKYSLALLLPKKWLQELGVKGGEYVGLEYDRRRRRIVIRFDATNPNSRPTKTTAKSKSSEESDWQPIPQL